MPLRAIAFQEEVAQEEIERIFKSETNQLFGGTAMLHCGHCKARFPTFFVAKDDEDNAAYARDIEVSLSEDCKQGNHSQFVRLEVFP